MGFNPGGGGALSTATDVALNTLQDEHVLTYDTDASKWQNQTGKVSNVDNLPAGSTISRIYSGSAWPSRGTARTDITVQWLDFTGSAPVPGDGLTDIDIVVRAANT